MSGNRPTTDKQQPQSKDESHHSADLSAKLTAESVAKLKEGSGGHKTTTSKHHQSNPMNSDRHYDHDRADRSVSFGSPYERSNGANHKGMPHSDKPHSRADGKENSEHKNDQSIDKSNDKNNDKKVKSDIGRQPYDAANPAPETWKYDKQGHLLSAGDRVKAEYDSQGNLTKANIGDSTFERKGNDVVATYMGVNGQPFSITAKNVSKFDLKISQGNDGGKYKMVSVMAESPTNGGAGGADVIWGDKEYRLNEQMHAAVRPKDF